MDWIETARILLPVMDALGAVHDKGIVHRDVTPDNIYITLDGKVKLIDFGAARYSIGDKTRSLDVVLKHGYAPKEQYVRRGRQGPYTDVYALGATFYYALSGRIPPDSISRIDEDDLIPLSTLGAKIPEEVENAISKALEVQPADRFQSMAEFKDALTGSIEDYNLDQVVVPINTIHEIHQTAPEPQKKETINLDEDSFFISAEELRASSERAKEYVEFSSPSDKASAEGDSEPSRFVTESVVHTGSRSDNLTELKVEYDATEDLEAKAAEGKFVTSQIEHDPRKSSTAGAERFTVKPWMIAAAVGVLGLIIGIIIFVATRTNGGDPKSTTTASERTTAATSATTESAEDTTGSSGSESSGEESASDANDGKDEESSETSEEDPTTTTTKAKGAEMSEDTKKTKESKDSKDTKSTTKGTTKSTSQTASEDGDDIDDTDYSDDDSDDTDDTEDTSDTSETTTSDTTTTTTTETTTTTTTEKPADTSEEPTSDSTLNEDL